jgi:hypothetical protein
MRPRPAAVKSVRMRHNIPRPRTRVAINSNATIAMKIVAPKISGLTSPYRPSGARRRSKPNLPFGVRPDKGHPKR